MRRARARPTIRGPAHAPLRPGPGGRPAAPALPSSVPPPRFLFASPPRGLRPSLEPSARKTGPDQHQKICISTSFLGAILGRVVRPQDRRSRRAPLSTALPCRASGRGPGCGRRRRSPPGGPQADQRPGPSSTRAPPGRTPADADPEHRTDAPPTVEERPLGAHVGPARRAGLPGVRPARAWPPARCAASPSRVRAAPANDPGLVGPVSRTVSGDLPEPRPASSRTDPRSRPAGPGAGRSGRALAPSGRHVAGERADRILHGAGWGRSGRGPGQFPEGAS